VIERHRGKIRSDCCDLIALPSVGRFFRGERCGRWGSFLRNLENFASHADALPSIQASKVERLQPTTRFET
jgi:hypothetical protein